MSKFLIVSITAIVMAAFAFAGWYYLNQKFAQDKNDQQTQIDQLQKELSDLQKTKSDNDKSTDVTGNLSGNTTETVNSLKTYTSAKFGYSFQYPSKLSLVDWYWNGQSNTRVSSEGKVVWLSKSALSERAIPLDADPVSQYFSVSVSDETCGLSALRGDGTGVVIEDVTLGGLPAWKVRITDNSNVMGGNYSTTYHANKGNYCYHLEIVNSDAVGTHDNSLDDIVASFAFN